MIKILVSACMMGNKVRYNGCDLSIESHTFRDLINAVEVVPFCPEVAGGLPTPREPAEIRDGDSSHVLNGTTQVITQSGNDVSSAFINGARLALATCLQQGISYALLTESSPSCGSNNIYNGRFEGIKIPGKGVTADLLQQHGIQVFSQYQLAELVQEIERYSSSNSG